MAVPQAQQSKIGLSVTPSNMESETVREITRLGNKCGSLTRHRHLGLVLSLKLGKRWGAVFID